MDNTALSTVYKPSKVIAHKEKHQVAAITSGERGLTIRGVYAMNAAGEFIPPIFPCSHDTSLTTVEQIIFESLKISYNETAFSWLCSNPGGGTKQANAAELLGKAYPRSARMEIALNGFEATGLWPCVGDSKY
ncbi:hypothetical protein PV325_009591 [Microctonus aethiopoides]|uniref:Uncharacterized protein n=1 Tax=Microctonus aethiopoides TaxID=144406 RepID=A0AA39C999_9HYME|nr:hypothetical protein PV325_009591 [Microctonus aethiopoides]KAK0081314.1 hypothetical protein PV326_007734 [Microctonus aethiopoides]KAK0160255.1 hypothetical protein PV328_007683 [Microctonus aethiopoides]